MIKLVFNKKILIVLFFVFIGLFLWKPIEPHALMTFYSNDGGAYGNTPQCGPHSTNAGNYFGEGPGNHAEGGYVAPQNDYNSTCPNSYWYAKVRYLNVGVPIPKSTIYHLSYYSTAPATMYISENGSEWHRVMNVINAATWTDISPSDLASLRNVNINKIKYFKFDCNGCSHLDAVSFTLYTTSAPNPPVITYPGSNQSSPSTNLRIGWNFSDNDPGDYQTAYQVVGTTTNWSSWQYDSGWVSSGNKFHDLSGLAQGNWHILVRYRDSSGVESAWAANDGITNYKVDTVAPSNGRVPVEWDTSYKEVSPGSNVFLRYVNVPDGQTFRVHVEGRHDNLSGTAMSAFWWQKVPPTGIGAWDYEEQNGIVWAGDSAWYKDIPVNGEGTYHVVSHVRDNAGNWNWNQRMEWNVYIDRTLPVAERFEPPYATNGSGPMRVHLFNITDNISGVNRVEYSSRKTAPDGTVEGWQNHGVGSPWNNGEPGVDNYYDVPNRGEGTYEIHAYTYDNAGNVNGPWKTTVTVDKVLPTHIENSISGADYIRGNDYYIKPGTTIETKIKVGDNSSGVASVSQVFTDDASEVESGYLRNEFYNNIKTTNNSWNTSRFTINNQSDNYSIGKKDVESVIKMTAKEVIGNYYYNWSYSAIDKAGNDNYVGNANKYLTTGKKIIIDGVSPVGNLIQNPSNETKTTDYVTITAKGTDSASGFKSIKLPDGTFMPDSEVTYKVSTNGTYTFVFYDNVGNSTSKTVTVSNIVSNYIYSKFNTITNTSFNAPPFDTGYEGSIKFLGAGLYKNATWNGSSFVLSGGKWAPGEELFVGSVGYLPTSNGVTKYTSLGSGWGDEDFKPVTKIQNAYNKDGGVNSYTYSRGSFITTIVAMDGTYPNDGIHTDGYWYVRGVVSGTDTIAPVGTLTQNPGADTKTSGNVTITVAAIDLGGSGLKQIRKPDGTIVHESTATFLVSKNGVYEFELEDNAGNKKMESIEITNINEHKPVAFFTGVIDSAIKKAYQFTLTTNDEDMGDMISYRISAGSAPGQSDYNNYLGTTSGTNRGVTINSFNLNQLPISELSWNATTSRYEKVVYLAATVTDGVESVTTTSQFVVFNHNPSLRMELPALHGHRNISETLDLSGYFIEMDGHEMQFTASVLDSKVATIKVSGALLEIEPRSIGSTNIKVVVSDGLGGSITTTFLYIVDNFVPNLEVTKVTSGIIGSEDTIIVTGTVADQDNDSVQISATLGGKTATTQITNGNGTWELHFEGFEVEEGIYTNLKVTADDGYDLVSKTHVFADLLVDNTMPFFWSITQKPVTPTSGEVTIQINVGDAVTGIKNLTNPDGTTTNKASSIYKVKENGKYEFIVKDKAGNKYTQFITIENIDSILPTVSALTLQQKTNNKYAVSVNTTDASGIQKVILNSGVALTRDINNPNVFGLDEIDTLPISVQVTDKAGNSSGNIGFLPMPIVSLNDYDSTIIKRTDVKGIIDGSNTLEYQVGSKKYVCSEKPCDFTVTKNSLLTVENRTTNKASLRNIIFSNIDKSNVNLVLIGERSTNKNKEIILEWNLNLLNPKIICTFQGGLVEFIPTSNPFTITGENTVYECKLIGEYGNNPIESNSYTIYPDYMGDSLPLSDSDDFSKRTIQKNIFVEKNIRGLSYFINFSKDNTNEQIPIPRVLLN